MLLSYKIYNYTHNTCCYSILPFHCAIKLEGGVSWLYPQPGALCLVNASPVEAPVRLSQGCVIVLGKTNMFRYNDPTEAADLRRNMTEMTRKASLMNQSLMSQSLSDLRHPQSRHSGEWKMFASDSDIKDIAEVLETGQTDTRSGSNETVSTLQVSGGSTVTTPRKEPEELDLSAGDSSLMTDINANPAHAHSTPVRRTDQCRDEKQESVSPMSETVDLCTGSTSAMVTSTMSSSSRGSSVALSQLYSDICEQKDVIMSCLDEDNCDIEQVIPAFHNYNILPYFIFS